MNRQFQHPKRSCRRALGTLLLALPLSGIAFQLPRGQAQPAPTLPAKKNPKPLSPEQKATVSKILSLSRQESLCKSLIDLKVDNATLQGVTARIKEMLPNQAVAVEVRGANPVRVGFDLKGTRVGDVLQHVAALAGCKLWVLSSGLLIAPESQLTEAERADVKRMQGGEWAKSTEAGGTGWSNQIVAQQLFAKAIAQEVTGSDTKPFPAGEVKTSVGNFSPDSQTMLQQLADWARGENRNVNPAAPPFHLSAESPVTVDTSDPKAISITFNSGISDVNAGMIGITVYPH